LLLTVSSSARALQHIRARITNAPDVGCESGISPLSSCVDFRMGRKFDRREWSP
jgi:hypothetical protein